MDGVVVQCVASSKRQQPTGGTAGIRSHVGGAVATVSNLAAASGGIAKGNLVESGHK